MTIEYQDIRPPMPARRSAARRTPARSFGSARATLALILREISTAYGATPGGYLWAVAEPVASIILLTAVFSYSFRSPPMGVNFAIYYATGMLPFLMFTNVSNKIALSLRFSKSLLAYPAVTFVDAIMARFLLAVATNLFVYTLVFVAIFLIYDTRTIPVVPGIALSFAMAAVLGLGIGTLNCFLFSLFEAWVSIWSILTRPLVILSCVLFPYAAVPEPFRSYLWYNPLVQIVGKMRGSFYPSYDDSYVSVTYVFGIALISLLLGLILLGRYYRYIINE